MDQREGCLGSLMNRTASLPSELPDKSELSGPLFSHSLDCGVEIDGILSPPPVEGNGNLIVLPSISTIEHGEALPHEIETQPTNDVLLYLCL